jgi:hypothetical protein
MNQANAKGSCLCGEVAYEIAGNMGIFQYCHCSRCRKFTGTAFGANLFVAPDQFKWVRGEECVGTYALPNAKHFATAFCRKCGSSLPWKSQTGRVVIVPAGTLDGDPGITPSQNIFYASRACWFRNPDELPKHDELPVKKN